MKTRAEIYGNEAAALLRIVTMYPGLNMQQLLCFHPGKEEIIKTLLSHLQKQGRIFQTDTGGYFPSGWAAKSDSSLIRAAWVLLDFIGQVEYHAPGDFPVKLIFFANGELYEIVYAASGQEALINHALRDDRSGGRRIILVDNPEDIRRIDCPGISGFCTVDAAGQVHYFTPNTRKPSTCVPAKHLPMYRNGAAWKKKPPKHRSPRRNRLLQQRNRQSAKLPNRHPPRINHPKRLRPPNLPVRRKALSPQTRIPSCLKQNYQIHRRF